MRFLGIFAECCNPKNFEKLETVYQCPECKRCFVFAEGYETDNGFLVRVGTEILKGAARFLY